MNVFIRSFTNSKNFGCFKMEIDKRTRLKDVERMISKDIGGEDFRRITLIEDFMRTVFSADISVPLKICNEAKVMAVLSFFSKIWINYIFERSPMVFEISLKECEDEDLNKNDVKEFFYSSGHYTGIYITPGISVEDLLAFVGKRKEFPIDPSGVPESLKIKAHFGKNKVESLYSSDISLDEFASSIFEELGLESDAYYRVYKGDLEECILMLEYIPYSIHEVFSRIKLKEVEALFGRDFAIEHDGENKILLEVVE